MLARWQLDQAEVEVLPDRVAEIVETCAGSCVVEIDDPDLVSLGRSWPGYRCRVPRKVMLIGLDC
ncbi:MAG: hypothetical protein WD380_10515, partial [Gaiellaceae bacterium]